MMAAAYQMSVMQWDKEKTKKEILTFGHSRRTVGDVERFIDGYARANRQKPSGIHAKEQMFRVHLLPFVGHKRLDAITIG